MPITALFILFDFIIYIPVYVDTSSSLVLVKSATGYFSALEYTTGGYLLGSMLMQFASIARGFYSSPPATQVNDISSASSDIDTAVERPVSETYSTSSFTHIQSPWKVRISSEPWRFILFILVLKSPATLPPTRWPMICPRTLHTCSRIALCLQMAGWLLVWRLWISLAAPCLALISS